MGFRFRKSFTILPGVRINLSKSGISTSIGRRGATVNIGRRGPRGTVGLPGTGLSYDRALPGGGALKGLRGIGCAAVVAGGALALAMCHGGGGSSGSVGGPHAAGQGAGRQGAGGQGAGGQGTGGQGATLPAARPRLAPPPSAADDDAECACGSGRQCTGARGGHYCLTTAGRKRYG